jgi:hypothetical protein
MLSISPQLDSLPETLSSTVLAIGPWHEGEFAVVRSQLADTDTWSVVADCQSASELLSRNDLLLELILLAEPLPNIYRPNQIEDLRRRAPLAQIVVVAGTWNEGELRTGKPYPGVLRLYWHEFSSWWRARTRTWSPSLDGPLTPRSGKFPATLKTSIAIHAATLATYEALSETLKTCGAECRWVRNPADFKPAAIGIWDGGQFDPSEWERLKSFALKLQQIGSPLIVLLDFPRKEHVARLETLGCAMILGKPYSIAELVTAIACQLGPR